VPLVVVVVVVVVVVFILISVRVSLAGESGHRGSNQATWLQYGFEVSC
jgi:type II secretory pathway component PulK